MAHYDNITLPGKLFLAPMAETSTPALRHVVKDFCSETVLFSEMLSAGAIAACAPNNGPLIHKRNFDNPLIYQIVGSDPPVMARACTILSDYGCYGVDINMGCPNHDIVKKGQGAYLLTDNNRARLIIQACRKSCPVRLSVKMRTGYTENNEAHYLNFIKMLEGEGVDFITVHPRYAKLSFRRKADWRLVSLAKQHLTIPVIGNGDIWSANDALRMIEETGCDAVMIGRAALGNPFIFRETVELVEHGRRILPPTIEERIAAAYQHLELACSFKGETVAVREMRKHLAWYTRGMRGAARIRETINQATTRQQINSIFDRLIVGEAGDRGRFLCHLPCHCWPGVGANSCVRPG